MTWLNQKKGVIDQYKEHLHKGRQPVVVVQNMIVYMFQNTNPKFLNDLLEQFSLGKIDKKLHIETIKEPIRISNSKFRTPRVNVKSKTIELHETFLSYLWCCTYSIFVNYVEKIDHPNLNKLNGSITHPISQENIDKADALFNYARYLIVDFEEWDIDTLPNPQRYLAEERDLVEQTNMLFTEATKFILCHEYVHIKLHIDKIDENTTDSNYLEFEIEADNTAIDMIKAGISYSSDPFSIAQRLAIESGLIIGILSMLFFRQSTKATRHPNTEDRITNSLLRLGLDDSHNAWGMACIGLEIWGKQFDHNFVWRKDFKNYKELYFDIVEQIKQL